MALNETRFTRDTVQCTYDSPASDQLEGPTQVSSEDDLTVTTVIEFASGIRVETQFHLLMLLIAASYY